MTPAFLLIKIQNFVSIQFLCVSGEPKSKAGKVLNEFENFKGFWNSPGGERKTDTNHYRLLTNGTELTVFTYIPLP